MVKNPPANARDESKRGVFNPWVGKIPGGGLGNPLKYSCLKDSIDRGAWWATVRGVAESWTWPKRLNSHARTYMKEECLHFISHNLSRPPTSKQDTESWTQVSTYQRLMAPLTGKLGKHSFRLWKINNHTASVLLGHWENKSQICSHSQRERRKSQN